jgi:hypothetical protein
VTGMNDFPIIYNKPTITPNPTSDYFTVTLSTVNENVEMTINDITGNIIYKTTATDTRKIKVNNKNFSSGI